MLVVHGDEMMATPNLDAHETNRRSWNAVTIAHNSHKKDQATFFRKGGSTLFPDEVELLGELSGKNLLHLQCNCGQDTLSLAHLGAKVTGVDISDDAIAFARQLSADSGIPATFERADLFAWLASAEPEQFDLVFSSYGVLGWLSNLSQWARGIARALRPSGRFVLLEFHPTMTMLKEDWTPGFSSMGGVEEPFEEGIGDYVGYSGDAMTPSGHQEGIVDFVNPHPVIEFGWSVGDIATALLDAGLRIEALREYPYSNAYAPFEGFRRIEGNRFTMPENRPAIPMMLGIVATK
jgi:SAM-dependent methyltransferase